MGEFNIKNQSIRGGMCKLVWSSGFAKKTGRNFTLAQKFVDSECLRLCAPLVPKDTGYLIKSGTVGTTLGSGNVIYNAPYARRQYYENQGNGERGARWFERMKAQHRETILKGANKLL